MSKNEKFHRRLFMFHNSDKVLLRYQKNSYMKTFQELPHFIVQYVDFVFNLLCFNFTSYKFSVYVLFDMKQQDLLSIFSLSPLTLMILLYLWMFLNFKMTNVDDECFVKPLKLFLQGKNNVFLD